jgi:hypothetical protein
VVRVRGVSVFVAVAVAAVVVAVGIAVVVAFEDAVAAAVAVAVAVAVGGKWVRVYRAGGTSALSFLNIPRWRVLVIMFVLVFVIVFVCVCVDGYVGEDMRENGECSLTLRDGCNRRSPLRTTVLLQRFYSGGTVVLHLCYSCVTVVLH